MTWYGQFETDRIIAEYFEGVEVGFAVEVGAYDGIKGSNSKYFEDIGWDCLCIEPNPYIFKELIGDDNYDEPTSGNRNCVCLNVACGNKKGVAKLQICKLKSGIQSSLTSLDPDYRLIQEYGHDIVEWEDIEVEVDTLTNILSGMGTPDFISIDTEGTELDVLHGLDLLQYRVKLLVVENNYQDNDIRQYLKDYGYHLHRRYKINDFYVKDQSWTLSK